VDSHEGRGRRFFRVDATNDRVVVALPRDWFEAKMPHGLYTEEELQAHNRWMQAQIPTHQSERELWVKSGISKVLNG